MHFASLAFCLIYFVQMANCMSNLNCDDLVLCKHLGTSEGHCAVSAAVKE